jgi:hypothetical protein
MRNARHPSSSRFVETFLSRLLLRKLDNFVLTRGHNSSRKIVLEVIGLQSLPQFYVYTRALLHGQPAGYEKKDVRYHYVRDFSCRYIEGKIPRLQSANR